MPAVLPAISGGAPSGERSRCRAGIRARGLPRAHRAVLLDRPDDALVEAPDTATSP